jgi:hypothetical protein
MHPSKALNMIASGTNNREGMNDLRSHDQISDVQEWEALRAHGQKLNRGEGKHIFMGDVEAYGE